ncbi:MAG: hypothetical protein KC421_23785 [Anaerolineales bacterium]|nr:hypothetical protein [Anaerolineales bacterium]
MRIRILIFILLIIGGLAACVEEEPEATPTVTVTAVPPTNTPIPEPTVTSTPRPTATPFAPTVVVADQTLTDDGKLIIESVFMTEPGWVVLFDTAGEAIGYTGVPAGSSQDIKIEVDPLDVTETLTAALHQDTGQIGTFAFPDEDPPLAEDDRSPTDTFNVTLDVTLPAVVAADQTVGEDGLVRLEVVLAVEPGWVVIHATDDGTIGTVLGSVFVEAGLHNNLVVPIQWREATPELAAILYEDNGRSRRLDLPGDDLPVLVGGSMVIDTFNVALPLDIVVYDQPVVDGTITVERIISNGPGHVVVYFDDGDVPGLIIGSENLVDGVNEQIVVKIIETAVTPQLFLFIHDDTNPGDNFDFPANDPPRLFNGRLPAPIAFNTTPGNYLVTRDQPLTQIDEATAVAVPLAVVDVPAWVAVHNNDNGERGEMLGVVQLTPGINRNLIIPVAETAVTDTLYAVLYLDAEPIGEFDFPDGPDVALQRNRNVIQAPFVLQSDDSE